MGKTSGYFARMRALTRSPRACAIGNFAVGSHRQGFSLGGYPCNPWFLFPDLGLRQRSFRTEAAFVHENLPNLLPSLPPGLQMKSPG